MADITEETTLAIIKPDAFWRHLDGQIEDRLKSINLTFVAHCTLDGADNLPQDKWKEFYFPSIGDKPPIFEGTSRYMAHGPIRVMVFRGENAVAKVRKAIGATRPWQADPGSIRGDFWTGADEANAAYRSQFQQPGDDKFLFNLIHASDSEKSFEREVQFFQHALRES